MKCWVNKTSQQNLCVISSSLWISQTTFRPRGPVLPPDPSLPCRKNKTKQICTLLENITASHTLIGTLLFHILFSSNIQGPTILNTPIRHCMRILVHHALILTSFILLPPIWRKVTETGQCRCCSHLPKHQPPAKTGVISWLALSADCETKANQFPSVSPWLLGFMRPGWRMKKEQNW